jgi:hypothetical protein
MPQRMIYHLCVLEIRYARPGKFGFLDKAAIGLHVLLVQAKPSAFRKSIKLCLDAYMLSNSNTQNPIFINGRPGWLKRGQ